MSQVEAKWGGVTRLQFEPAPTLDDELDNWRNPVVKKQVDQDELADHLSKELGVEVNASDFLHINYTDKTQVVQPELPNFTHSLGENDEDS
jgi:hypothetical protein